MIAFIALGSNLDNPQHHILCAFDDLNQIPNTRVLKTSRLCTSKPMGPEGQPDYINAVAQIQTALSAEDLLKALHDIEDKHQRQRGPVRWGPRTLDLDIALYNDEEIHTDTLTIPHQGLCVRDFVLQPLLEIAPKQCLPDGRELMEIFRELESEYLF